MKKISLVFLSIILCSLNAFADQAKPWQLGFQEAVTPIMHNFNNFHNLLLVIITAITIFVLGLLAYVCVRFHRKNNPTPSKTSHNTLLEIVWTTVPVIILLLIVIPSVRTIYLVDKVIDADMTLKVVGYQWYWGYQYPDHGDFYFDSYMKKDEEIKGSEVRLLEVDNKVVLPINTNIRVQITGGDVIHSWAVPAFGFKVDAIPGKLNEGWINIEKEGTYYGQCSELCGVGHGFMPIQIEAVSKEKFEEWVKKAKEEFALNSPYGNNVNYLASAK